MFINTGKNDLRRTKTRRALYVSLSLLLSSYNFEKITVTDICEEALISRAAFYTYFLDKYDLLKYWLMDLWTKNMDNNYTYDQMEKTVNQCIHTNESALKNLLYDADNETINILFDFILSTSNLTIEKNNSKYPNDIVLSNFCAGGMIFYLLWQVNNKFPSDVQPMNIHLYEIIRKFQEWKSEKNKQQGEFLR